MFKKKTLIEKLKEKIVSLIILAILLLLPLIGLRGYWLDVLIRMNIFLVFAITLDFFSGTTYYLNLGHSFIIGLAAYILAILNVYYNVPVEMGIIVAAILSSILSLILFLPSLRVKGVYFAIMSLLFPIVFTGLATTQPFSLYLGGEGGLRSKQLFFGIIKMLPPNTRLIFLQLSYYYLSLLIAIMSYIILYRLGYSGFGYTLRAIGQDEELAEASGVNTTIEKLKGFLIASFLASLAGSFYAAIKPPVTLDYVSTSTILLPILTAMIIGGMGSIIGTAIAVYTLTFVYEILWGFVGEWRTLIYMLLLLIFVIIRPHGIMFYLYLKFKKYYEAFIKR